MDSVPLHHRREVVTHTHSYMFTWQSVGTLITLVYDIVIPRYDLALLQCKFICFAHFIPVKNLLEKFESILYHTILINKKYLLGTYYSHYLSLKYGSITQNHAHKPRTMFHCCSASSISVDGAVCLSHQHIYIYVDIYKLYTVFASCLNI